jgi:hypothetical protein
MLSFAVPPPFFWVLGIKVRTLHVLGKCSTTELHPTPSAHFVFKYCLVVGHLEGFCYFFMYSVAINMIKCKSCVTVTISTLFSLLAKLYSKDIVSVYRPSKIDGKDHPPALLPILYIII